MEKRLILVLLVSAVLAVGVTALTAWIGNANIHLRVTTERPLTMLGTEWDIRFTVHRDPVLSPAPTPGAACTPAPVTDSR